MDVIVKVSFPAWSDAPKSWKLLTVRSPNGKGWSGGTWLPKNKCTLEESRHEKGVGILTLPEWLYNIKSKEGVEFTNLNNEII
jgi:hypothetical protein